MIYRFKGDESTYRVEGTSLFCYFRTSEEELDLDEQEANEELLSPDGMYSESAVPRNIEDFSGFFQNTFHIEELI